MSTGVYDAPQSYCGIWYYDTNKAFLGKVDALGVIPGYYENTVTVDEANLIYKINIGVDIKNVALSYASQIEYARLVLTTNPQKITTAITSSAIENIVIKLDEIIT